MRQRRAVWRIVPLAAALCAVRLAAQEPTGVELGVGGFTAFTRPTVVAPGLGVAVRPGGQGRLALNLIPWSRGGRFAARAELLGHFILAPGRRRGLTVYGLAGVAGEVGPVDAGRLVAGLGAESSPGGRSGWYLEAGVGGGVRLAAGWRLRWLRRAGTQMP